MENGKENELQVEDTVSKVFDKQDEGFKCCRDSKLILHKNYMIFCVVLICTCVAIIICVTLLINSDSNYYLTVEIIVYLLDIGCISYLI